MKKSTIAIAVVLGFLGVIGLAAAVVAFGYFAVKGVSTDPPDDVQKRLVLGAEAFEPFDLELDPKCIKFRSTRNLDRTRTIEFEHDCEGSNVFIASEAEISPSVRDARESFVLSVGAYKTGVAIGAGELQPRDELLPIGEQRYAAVIRNGGKPVGNVFVVRQGRVLHSLLVTGIYFEDAGDVRDLFEPLLAESKRQFPK